MNVEQVPVGELDEHPANPRQGDVGAITESIRLNGWFGTLVAQQSTRRVLVGNHRLKAARALEMETVPVMWVDVDDDRALRILLADNRSSDLAAYDDSALADLLMDLATATEAALEGSVYDGDFLDRLLGDLSTEMPMRRDAVPPAERKVLQYDVSSIRQIILIMDPETFGRVLTIARHLRELESLETNTDLIVGLLNREAERVGFDPDA